MNYNRIPFDIPAIIFQVVGWGVFFGIIIAAYASVIQHAPTPTVDQLIDQVGHHN